MDDTLQLLGLPLHPLLVHAVVVLIPLVVLAVLLTQFWPAVRRRLGAVTPLGAAVVLALVPLTVVAGESLAEAVGPIPAVTAHQRLGEMLLPWVVVLFLVAVAQWAWFRWGERRPCERRRGRARAIQAGLTVAAVAASAGTLVLILLIGESGSRAVWGGLLG